jgi:hypothetical protein
MALGLRNERMRERLNYIGIIMQADFGDSIQNEEMCRREQVTKRRFV